MLPIYLVSALKREMQYAEEMKLYVFDVRLIMFILYVSGQFLGFSKGNLDIGLFQHRSLFYIKQEGHGNVQNLF